MTPTRPERHRFDFHDTVFEALPCGALWWPARATLVVSDLHLGRAARGLHGGAALLPPYDALETLARLDTALSTTGARRVIALGDSLDAPDSDAHLPAVAREELSRLVRGYEWVWIAGNHDPIAPSQQIRGERASGFSDAGLHFCHIAQACADPTGNLIPEISGHYHPKLRRRIKGVQIARACFLLGRQRLILPAYGAFSGGMDADRPPLSDLAGPGALALLTGNRVVALRLA